MVNNAQRKAQKIVNEVDERLGLALVAYSNEELVYLRDMLDQLLQTGIEMDELVDAEEDDMDEDLDDDMDEDLDD
jgi:hypothetical protein